MTLWETEVAEETARNQMWEDLNDILYEEEEEAEPDYTGAYDNLSDVWDNLSEAYDRLATAAQKVGGTVDEPKILSVQDDIEKLEKAIKGIMAQLMKEARSA